MVDYKRLKSLLVYDCLTGNFFWRNNRGHMRLGEVAEHHSRGYLRIGIDREQYAAHRLAWLWFYKRWPKSEIDHIDQDKANNRIANLREATRTLNVRNVPMRRDNLSGCCGVSWDSRRSKWYAQMRNGSTPIYLGRFTKKSDAIKAYAKGVASR